jgi:RHS repeat-associated protein
VRYRNGGSRFDYFPYGEEKPGATAQGVEKFATYERDHTGLDYADQRYFANTNGRFTSADSREESGRAGDLAGASRYAYAGGDPVNKGDPTGHLSEGFCDSVFLFAPSCEGDEFFTGSRRPAGDNESWNWFYSTHLPAPGGGWQSYEGYCQPVILAWQTTGNVPGSGDPCFSYFQTVQNSITAIVPPKYSCEVGFFAEGVLFRSAGGALFGGGDLNFAGRAVYGEAGGTLAGGTFNERLGVSSVVFNRSDDPTSFGALPGTGLTGILTAPKQFDAVTNPTQNGKFLRSGNVATLDANECYDLSRSLDAIFSTLMNGPKYSYTFFLGGRREGGDVIGTSTFYTRQP